MNPREELRELIAQAKEHLRYYGELGLTHVGETSVPAAPEPKVEGLAAVASAPTTSAAPEPKRPEQLAPTIIPLPQGAPKPTITMPTKQENSAVASLFGEAAPSLTETPHADETLEDIRRDLGDCRRCKLAPTRTNIVFGEGNSKAELMF